MMWVIKYRECNITDWHEKTFLTKLGAKRFRAKLRKKKYYDCMVYDFLQEMSW